MSHIASILFGFTHHDLDDARRAVEQCLAIDLSPHDSLYLGDYYRGAASQGQELELRRNVDPLFDSRNDLPEDRYAEPTFPDAHLLLYVHGPDLDSMLQSLQRITGIVKLRFEKAV
jgi:hypothetical protein